MEEKEVTELSNSWETFLAGPLCTTTLHSFSEPKTITPHQTMQFQGEAYTWYNKMGGLKISKLKILL